MTKILWTGPINGLGYGQASAGYAAGLIHHKALAGHINIGDIDPKDPEIASGELTSQVAAITGTRNRNGETPSVGFWHFPHHKEIAGGSPRVIMSTFEVDDFPEEVLSALSKFDAVGTASTWGEAILKKRLPNTPVFSSPHAFSLLGNHPISPVQNHAQRMKKWNGHLGLNLPENTQILGNIGKYEHRKGHRELLDTVLGIGERRPILLILSWFNPFMYQNYPFFAFHERDMTPRQTLAGSMYVYQKKQATVVLVPRMSSKEGLLQIMRNVDTYVSASYCEGWDLPLFEMMSHGTHCIATLNTAHLDYCSNENVTPLIKFDVVSAIDDTPFFSGRGTWNQIDPEELRHCIDTSYQMNENDRRAIGKKAEEKCRKFSWAKSAKKIMQVVESLQSTVTTTKASGKIV